MAEAATLNVLVVWADAQRKVHERALALAAGACIQDALAACSLSLGEQQACGVWGRTQLPTQVLQDGDRVELYQPLKVDPKVARRERFAQQGARGAGLFASRRAHSKAGY